MADQIQVVGAELERLANLFQFIHEATGFPQRILMRLVAVGRAQLVVHVVLDAGARKVAVEGGEDLVVAAGAAVQQQYLDRGVIAGAPGPDAKFSLRRVDLDHLLAAGEDIVAPAVVEIVERRPGRGRGSGRGGRCRNGNRCWTGAGQYQTGTQ